MTRLCDWCQQAIASTTRVDAVCCSVRCRQARHRFKSGAGALPVASGRPLRLAYADPPYPGLSKKYYSDHPDYAGEVDHDELISRLTSTFDGWALSTSARALPSVLASCPPGVRVAAWVRGERPTRSAWPLNAWEPVIYWGGRQAVASGSGRDGSGGVVLAGEDDASWPAGRDALAIATRRVAPGSVTEYSHDASHVATHDASWLQARRVDALVYRPGVRLTDPNRVIGAKPAEFCQWVFQLLGATRGDEFVDIFPGSAGVARAWRYASTSA